jgi:hypothetical protein
LVHLHILEFYTAKLLSQTGPSIELRQERALTKINEKAAPLQIVIAGIASLIAGAD